ncbi:MAG: hypothetical protein J6M31_02895 [Bacteroidales bacterium]|nr:hypothetical protein [Bacteroidales bacterium]
MTLEPKTQIHIYGTYLLRITVWYCSQASGACACRRYRQSAFCDCGIIYLQSGAPRLAYQRVL